MYDLDIIYIKLKEIYLNLMKLDPERRTKNEKMLHKSIRGGHAGRNFVYKKGLLCRVIIYQNQISNCWLIVFNFVYFVYLQASIAGIRVIICQKRFISIWI